MMKRNLLKIFSVFVLMSLAMSSCMRGPQYQKPESNASQKYRFDTLANAQKDTILNLRWWEIFDDATLNKLIKTALDQNKDVRLAASRIAEARAMYGYTRADQYPIIDFSGGASSGNFSGMRLAQVTSNYFLTPTLSWELDFWGKYRSASIAAQSDLLASEYGHRAVQISLISSVAKSYYSLLDYQNRLAISEKTLAARDSSLMIIQARYDKGYSNELDLNQAQIQKAVAATSIPVFRRGVAIRENALSLLLGQNPSAITTGKNIQDQNNKVEIPYGIPSLLLERRPDIAEAGENYRAQNALISQAIAMRLPSISLTGLLGAASNDLSTITSQGLAWSVGANILGPIFQFGKNKRRVDIQREKANQSLIIYERTVLTAFKEVEDALVSIQTYQEEIAARDFQATAAMNAEELSRIRYERGVSTYLEVLETQRSSFDAQLGLSGALEGLLSTYIDLYSSLGGGWISPQEETNSKP